jgi:hypothetical protein
MQSSTLGILDQYLGIIAIAQFPITTADVGRNDHPDELLKK